MCGVHACLHGAVVLWRVFAAAAAACAAAVVVLDVPHAPRVLQQRGHWSTEQQCAGPAPPRSPTTAAPTAAKQSNTAAHTSLLVSCVLCLLVSRCQGVMCVMCHAFLRFPTTPPAAAMATTTSQPALAIAITAAVCHNSVCCVKHLLLQVLLRKSDAVFDGQPAFMWHPHSCGTLSLFVHYQATVYMMGGLAMQGKNSLGR